MDDYDFPPEPLIVLGHKGMASIESIVGTEPITSSELVRRLWDWVLANGLLQNGAAE